MISRPDCRTISTSPTCIASWSTWQIRTSGPTVTWSSCTATTTTSRCCREVDTVFRELDSKLRLRREQHKMLVRRRDDLLTTPRPEFLATPEEQRLMLDRIEAARNDG